MNEALAAKLPSGGAKVKQPQAYRWLRTRCGLLRMQGIDRVFKLVSPV